jgi:hypothetical protein
MLQDLRPQLESILGSPSYYQPSESEDVTTKQGKFMASFSSGSEEGRKPKKVRPRKRAAQQRPAANNNQQQDPNNVFNQFFPQNQNNNDENMDVDDDNNNAEAGQQCKQQ